MLVSFFQLLPLSKTLHLQVSSNPKQWDRCSRTQAVLAECPKTTKATAVPHSHFSLINTWTAGRVYYTVFLHPCATTQDHLQPWSKVSERKPLILAAQSRMSHLPGEVHETKIAQAHSKLFTLNNEKERRLWEQTCCSLHWVMCQPWRAVSKQVLPSTTSPCEAGRCSIAAAQPSCPRKKQVPCRSRNIWPTGSWRHSICQQEWQTKCYWQQRVGGETSEICHIKAAWQQYCPLQSPARGCTSLLALHPNHVWKGKDSNKVLLWL